MPPNEQPITAAFIENTRRAVAPVPDGQIRVEDKLYSTQKLADLHPGGPLFVKVDILCRINGAFILVDIGYRNTVQSYSETNNILNNHFA